MPDKRAYDYATRNLAEQLYVFRNRTYEEIASELGVSLVQLKRWGCTGEWKDKREQYLNNKAQTLTRLIGIQEHILEKLEAEIEPNTVHQLIAALRQTDSFIEAKISPTTADIDRPALFLEDLRFIVFTLKELDPKGVETIARNYDALIEAFKRRLVASTNKG